MAENKAKQGWESKQKAYGGEEEDIEGAKRGRRGCWASWCPEETGQVLWPGNKPWVIGIIFRTWTKPPTAWNRWVFRRIQSAAFLTI